MDDLDRIKKNTGYSDGDLRQMAEEASRQRPEIREVHEAICRIAGHQPCDCCGTPYRNDCVIGHQCSCGFDRCAVCHKCSQHCTCPGGYKTTEQSIIEELKRLVVQIDKERLALLEENARLREMLHRILRTLGRCPICGQTVAHGAGCPLDAALAGKESEA